MRVYDRHVSNRHVSLARVLEDTVQTEGGSQFTSTNPLPLYAMTAAFWHWIALLRSNT